MSNGALFVEAGGSGGFDELLERGQRRVLVSAHDFSGIPADLNGQVNAMRATGATVIKIAVTPARLVGDAAAAPGGK